MRSPLLPLFLQQKTVSTDTRKLIPGCIFFALQGETFDGNKYAATALQNGAAYAVIDNPEYLPENDNRYYLVPNALYALQVLARDYRRLHLDIPIIGITGSNGKTTTKELIASVLRTEKKVAATQGNLNNHIGVPLTLLSIPLDTEIAIVEMGANQPGDIQELVEIAQPTHGIITNIGKAHLEKLLNIEGVKHEKGAMFRYVQANKGTFFANINDANIASLIENARNVISYGNKDTADFSYQIHSLSPEKMEVSVRNKHQNICVFSAQITGDYNALNVVAAVCIGETFGISTANIQQGIYSYVPTNQRSQLVEKKDYKIWLDCYNANPSSMKASLEGVCHTFPQEKKCLILGDMLELGAESQGEHEAIADLLASLSPFWVIFVGKEMKHAHLLYTGKSLYYEKVTEISPDLKNEILNEGIEFVLLKGSRGMGLEKCMDWL